MAGSCAVCSKPASQRCAVCKSVNYCNKNHQKQHWKTHKNECKCFEVATSSKLGRHMVALRNITAGEVILKESPLVCGPKVLAFAQCLGCHCKLTGSSVDDEMLKSFYYCRKCNWPLCSPKCEKSPVHQAECAVLAKSKHKTVIKYQEEEQKVPAYCAIVPLRCFLLPPEKLNELLSLESNLEVLINTTLYNVFRINIVGYLHKALGLTQYNEETILKVAAVLDTNSFEIRRDKGNIRIRGLYPKAAMMSHSCKPNTKHFFVGDDFTMVVMATTDIKKGEIINATYTQTLWSTQERRQHLKISKCFDCDCERCVDPTEFNTFISCILCSKCKGYMLCEDPLDPSSRWKCHKCSHLINTKQMAFGNEALKRELENTGKTIPILEALVNKYLKDEGSVLHPTNCHIIQAKHALIQLYGVHLSELSSEQLDYAESICNDLLDLADKLDPGMTRFRGTLLYDLQAIKVVKVKAEFEKDLITKDKAQELLTEVTELLQEATKILKHEPDMITLLEERVKELDQLCST
ncbi:SET domain-containing protein SmydA-8-like [Macrosteles quadrilineatus]|uniref:SET domain-containing protein SmydA-8-like n=1 Tax=Macrosteles quadrilineatus TaxID=74068 RepID=UPI0023E09273|nr:SET domain-containing protein SmydA-8-like [Macrosteles quadrilineatus]